MDSGIECTLSIFINETKLCGAVNTQDRRDASRGDLDRLEWWTYEYHENLMKFNKAKWKILRLGLDNPKQQYSLVREWIKTSPGEKDLEAFVDKKLNMNWLCMLPAQKANHILAASKEVWPGSQRRWFFPSTVFLWDLTWSTLPSSGIPSTRKFWTC